LKQIGLVAIAAADAVLTKDVAEQGCFILILNQPMKKRSPSSKLESNR
jgi:hypothetical protein